MCLKCIRGLFRRNVSVPTYPFDIHKAYRTIRTGIIAGGSIRYSFDDDGVVTYYEYPRYPPENECGMRDRGAEVFFVGLKPGTVTVTVTEQSPVGDKDEYTFRLTVDEELRVTETTDE